jgi:hypothetical protein
MATGGKSHRGTTLRVKTESHNTIDHDKIKQWVEKRGGTPSRYIGTERADDVGDLSISFPGSDIEPYLEPISWERWFGKFEEKKYSFLFQEKELDGEQSTHFRLLARAEMEPGHEDAGKSD